jgi:hypothetical protein
MRVIFLDIDGVLCTERSHLSTSEPRGHLMTEWDATSAKLIRNLCVENNFKIVVSSTWRIVDNRSLLIKKLADYDLLEFLHDDSYTPVIHFSSARGEEIQDWLNRHKEVELYIIIDDIDEMLMDQQKYFIKTDEYEGFGAANFMRAKRIIAEYENRKETK